jgi:hypothetical protein
VLSSQQLMELSRHCRETRALGLYCAATSS